MPLPKRSVSIEAPQPVELIEENNSDQESDEELEQFVFQLSSLTQKVR